MTNDSKAKGSAVLARYNERLNTYYASLLERTKSGEDLFPQSDPLEQQLTGILESTGEGREERFVRITNRIFKTH